MFTEPPGTPTLVHSSTRSSPYLCGVLLLEGHKTYGRTANKKRLLYRVVPESAHLPAFLVPYEIAAQFRKCTKNKYVLFRFDAWTDTHPRGLLHEVLGDVDVLEVFYEYQLYSKCVHSSLKSFTKSVHECTKKDTMEAYLACIVGSSRGAGMIEDRAHCTGIFTIDPKQSVDYDDALDIQLDPETKQVRVSVYLANVFVWLELFQLWNAFTPLRTENALGDRVSTIYLPDRRRTMLPAQLSETFCSLREQETKVAFVVDMTLDAADGRIVATTLGNALIRVNRNYVYEEDALQQDPTFQQLKMLMVQWNVPAATSMELVAHWMLEANRACAQHMYRNQTGMFQTVTSTRKHSGQDTGENEAKRSFLTVGSTFRNESAVPPNIVHEHAIQQWLSCTGQYESYTTFVHTRAAADRAVYAQVTSPIRRLVDLLNQMMILSTLGMVRSEGAQLFLDHWLNRIPYINASMRSIRKIQSDCSLLHRCLHHPDMLQHTHRGMVFDKLRKQNGLFGYMVYLEDCKLLSRLTTSVEWDNHSHHEFRILLFETAHQTKKKIRVEVEGTYG